MYDNMSNPATHANGSRQANRSLVDYSNLCLSPLAPGNKYPWTSLSNFPRPKQGLTQLLCLLTRFPRWFTLHLPPPRPQPQTLPVYSSIMFSDSMAFQDPSFPTAMPSSPASSG